MDDQYLGAFIRESEEAITNLNNSLLDLESDPDDQEAMDSIFRTAHTLKGNFGAMGFEDASNLAHAVEDLLDAMRQDQMEVTAERMDLIFAGVDMIEVIVREIESEGESTTDTEEMVAQRAVLEESDFNAETGAVEPSTAPAGGPAGDAESAGAPVDDDGGSDDGLDLDALGVSPGDADEQIVRARVSVGEGDMLGVDAMLALDRITDAFDLLGAAPDRDAIESGDFEEDFVLALDAPDADAVAAELDAISAVESADATELSSLIRPGPTRPLPRTTGRPTRTAKRAPRSTRSSRSASTSTSWTTSTAWSNSSSPAGSSSAGPSRRRTSPAPRRT
ncbi:Hpt domain-containing protein [Halosimplex aquaticum]